MKRCDLCGKICWRDRTVVSAIDGMNPKKIVIKGKEYTEVKLCRKCTNALVNMVINAEVKE